MHHSGNPDFKEDFILFALNTTMCAYCNSFVFFYPVKAEREGSFIPESYIWDDFNAVILQPNGYCSATICIPHLHDKRHISIKAKIRGYDTLELFQLIEILSWLVSKPFKIPVMLVKDHPTVKIVPCFRHCL